MQKPNNFDSTSSGGDFTPIETGGHHAFIKSVKEQKSQTGKNMVVVAIDFAKNDKQPFYFKEQFENDTRPEKKWPYQAVQYIVTEDANGNCSRSFKGFITAFERSNNVLTDWGDKFTEQFKDKKIGVVYGEVEEEYNGEVKTRRRIRWFCEDAKADDASIPAKKLLSNSIVNASGFKSVPTDMEDEIPF